MKGNDDMLNRDTCPRKTTLWTKQRFYGKACERCQEVVKIGKRKFCGYTPGRVALHQTVRSQAGCVSAREICKHVHKKLDSETCLKCYARHPDALPLVDFLVDLNTGYTQTDWYLDNFNVLDERNKLQYEFNAIFRREFRRLVNGEITDAEFKDIQAENKALYKLACYKKERRTDGKKEKP